MEFNIPGGKGTEETKITNNGKPTPGMKKVTKEPLISSLQEAKDFINQLGSRTHQAMACEYMLDIARTGSKSEKKEGWEFILSMDNQRSSSEKRQTYEFILNIAKLGSRTEKIEANFFIAKQYIENEFISVSQKLHAVEKLGELKAVHELVILIQSAPEFVVAKEAKKEFEEMFQEFVKEKNVDALKYIALDISISKTVAKKVVKELIKLKAVKALESLGRQDIYGKIIKDVVKGLIKLKDVPSLKSLYGRFLYEKPFKYIDKKLRKLEKKIKP